MNQRRTLRIIAILFFCFVPFAAQAAPKDAAAMSKIDEARNHSTSEGTNDEDQRGG